MRHFLSDFGRGLRLGFPALLLLLTAAPTDCHADPHTFNWNQLADNPAWWGLHLDGRALGAWSSDEQVYRPLLAFPDNYGPPCPPPCELPFANSEFDPANNFGVILNRARGIRYGGEGTRTLDNLIAAVDADRNAQVPAFEKMPSLTIVAKDQKTGEKIAEDFKTHFAFSKFWHTYGQRCKVYTPDNFAVKVFRLEIDRRFQQCGVVVIIQPAPDADDKAPVRKIYGYDGPEAFASRLRDVDPGYDPNAEPTGLDAGPWTRLDIALAVGLAVTAIYSFLLGGILRWQRS